MSAKIRFTDKIVITLSQAFACMPRIVQTFARLIAKLFLKILAKTSSQYVHFKTFINTLACTHMDAKEILGQ